MSAAAPETPRELTLLSEGHHFLEGPRWHDGRLYVSDFFAHRVYSLEPGSELVPVCEVPGQPSGLGFTPDGDLLVVSMTDQRLLRLHGDELTEVADLSGVATGLCNDMLVDAEGRAYVGNFGWDSNADPALQTADLALVEPDGTVRVAATELVFPNGAVLTPDGRTLLISETFAGRITAYDVASDGSLGGRRAWAAFPGDTGDTLPAAVESGVPLPDGMALDAEGAVWIGDAAGDGALRVAEGGEIVDRVSTGDGAVYAVALGGPDRRTLYMCVAPPLLRGDPSAERRGRLLSCRVEVPGSGRP